MNITSRSTIQTVSLSWNERPYGKYPGRMVQENSGTAQASVQKTKAESLFLRLCTGKQNYHSGHQQEKHRGDKEYLCMMRSVIEKLVIFHYNEKPQAGTFIESLTNHYHFKGYLQCDVFADYETAFRTNSNMRGCSINCLVLSVVILNKRWMKTRR